MVKTLFNMCVAAITQHHQFEYLSELPSICKQRLLEFFSSHDQLLISECVKLVSSASFGRNLSELRFYSSDQLTDSILDALTGHCHSLQYIAIIFCQNISDKGIRSITEGQKKLKSLELRALKKLTSAGLALIHSEYLHTVDLSSCTQIANDGIYQLVNLNRNITSLYLNCCKGLSDQALYDIAHYLGEKLMILELDFLPNVISPGTVLFYLSYKCTNIKQLSLCRFFEVEPDIALISDYRIAGMCLRDVDLFGNYFCAIPMLPPTVIRIRLSVCGNENVATLIDRLQSLPMLRSIHLQLICKEQNYRSSEDANRLLNHIIPFVGTKITRLHISSPWISDASFHLITQCLPNLSHLALDVKHMNNKLLRLYFTGGNRSPGSQLISLKLCRSRITYRALFAIARGARSIVELEVSHMMCVDDRFLSLLAENCLFLKNVNFNGCRFVSDKGLVALARKCSLKEVRIRATSCTDKSIYLLAQFCPDLEWIAHADYSGHPKFSDKALQCLRDSCVQRVIC